MSIFKLATRNSKILYLASRSARRSQILKRLRIPFRVVSSSYRERDIPGKAPSELARIHARGKEKLAQIPAGARYVLAADTVVSLKGRIFGKPANLQEARQMLASLSGRMHVVYTAVFLSDRLTDRCLEGIKKTKVWIRNLKEAEINRYLKAIHPFDKAGSYAIQSGPRVVEKIKGSYTNVMGFPDGLVKKMWQDIRRPPVKSSLKSRISKPKRGLL